MKITDKDLKPVFSYSNVIVEKNEQDLKLPLSVPVMRNYKINEVIGIARPRYINGTILCNIDVFEDVSGMFPGICFNTHPENSMLYLSMNVEPNIDATIKAI